MRAWTATLGYAGSVALATWAGHGLYTQALALHAAPGSSAAAAFCALVAAALAWPRRPPDGRIRKRLPFEIGSRTAGVFYLMFTAVTVVEHAPDYLDFVSGTAELVMVLAFSLPLTILFSTGGMIYATAGAGFFVSIALATVWLRLARRFPAPAQAQARAPAPAPAQAQARAPAPAPAERGMFSSRS